MLNIKNVDSQKDQKICFKGVYSKEQNITASKKIKLAIKNFLIVNPFFGVLCLRQELVEASIWCPTMAVDGKHLFFNTGFVLSKNPFEIQFIISHEILHLAYGHLDRLFYKSVNKKGAEKRNLKIFNIACDYIVNRDSLAANIGEMPENLYYDKKYDGWIAEEVYEDIKNKDFILPTLDYHLDLSGNNISNQDAGITVSSDGLKHSSREPNYNKSNVKKNLDDFLSDLTVAKSSIRSEDISAGKIPANLIRIINELTEPKINWRHYIRKIIQSHFKQDLNWNKVSRRSSNLDFILPDKSYGEKVNIHISIDTSGSMTNDMLRDFLSEIKGILLQYKDYEINLWTFDTKIHNHQKFTTQNIRKIEEYKLNGGGGTTFLTNWNYMKEHKIKPDLFIMFTDGYPCDDYGVLPKYCDTLYIIYENRDNLIKIPKEYGRSVNYDLYQ